MSEVKAAIFRAGNVIEHASLDAGTPQHGEPALVWIEVLNPLDRDFTALQERFRAA